MDSFEKSGIFIIKHTVILVRIGYFLNLTIFHFILTILIDTMYLILKVPFPNFLGKTKQSYTTEKTRIYKQSLPELEISLNTRLT